MFKITLKNENTIESFKTNQSNVRPREYRAKCLLFDDDADLDDEILANEKKIIYKVILNNNKYVFLYDINITNYTVTGTDRHNEKWVFPKSEIKEICLEKENENEKNNT